MNNQLNQGQLIMELAPWYGSAALMQVNDTHKKLIKLKRTMTRPEKRSLTNNMTFID